MSADSDAFRHPGQLQFVARVVPWVIGLHQVSLSVIVNMGMAGCWRSVARVFNMTGRGDHTEPLKGHVGGFCDIISFPQNIFRSLEIIFHSLEIYFMNDYEYMTINK